MRDPLSIISDLKAPPNDVNKAFEEISAQRVNEPPGFWVRIINNAEYGKARRERCLIEFFRRHVPSGLPIMRLAEIDGISAWFDQHTVFDMSMASAVPVRRGEGSIFLFQPEFVRGGKSPLGIYIRLSKDISVAQLLDVIHGQNVDETLTIAEVGISGA